MTAIAFFFGGLFLCFAWGRYHLSKDGRGHGRHTRAYRSVRSHRNAQDVPPLLHVIWLIIGLIAVAAGYIMIATQ
jgi:hypothetical protein